MNAKNSTILNKNVETAQERISERMKTEWVAECEIHLRYSSALFISVDISNTSFYQANIYLWLITSTAMEFNSYLHRIRFVNCQTSLLSIARYLYLIMQGISVLEIKVVVYRLVYFKQWERIQRTFGTQLSTKKCEALL